jgi:2-hydroxychromene-2-carboxylate isomerase
MKRHRIVLLAILLLVAPAAADEVEIRGRVLDATGAPLEGVAVGTYWTVDGGRWVVRQGVETDAEGGFTLRYRPSRRTRSVMALDVTQARGAVALLDSKSAAEPIVLRLVPTTRVQGAFENSGLGAPPEKTYVSFTALPGQIAVASYVGDPRFALALPPGDYRLGVGATDCKRIAKRITLTSDMRVVDLGTTDLEPTVVAQHYGKAPPPWNVTDARGVEASVQLADYKGKWVLLEFWGHW